MSYKCGICGCVVTHGKQQLKHVVKRPDGSILREVPVCERCDDGLHAGKTMSDLARLHGPKVDMPAALEDTIGAMPKAAFADKPPRSKPVFARK